MLDLDTTDDHLRSVGMLVDRLHTVFHELAVCVDGGRVFSDDPCAPLRERYAAGEELRERLVQESGRARTLASIEGT
jgi:hypothetical protein